ncbi:MAG: hypothetical protein IT488_13690 [Gammaproteobacteria bacterium]|nr:hypothetical protein [Gammaproteobacteria bacterium]
MKGYSAFVTGSDVEPDLEYSVNSLDPPGFELLFNNELAQTAEDEYDLIYYFEKHMTMEVQKLRQDLLFMHAAALEYNGRALLLVAPSGSGKSTTTWALINSGFRYLSDELAPIHTGTLQVHPYPHALCLKAEPPKPFSLPDETLHTSYTLHVPVEGFPGDWGREPAPLAAIFFLRYDPESGEPQVKPISKGEAGARIYSNALNLLAHARYGLDAAVKVAGHSLCLELVTNDLRKTCDLIKSTLQH